MNDFSATASLMREWQGRGPQYSRAGVERTGGWGLVTAVQHDATTSEGTWYSRDRPPLKVFAYLLGWGPPTTTSAEAAANPR